MSLYQMIMAVKKIIIVGLQDTTVFALSSHKHFWTRFGATKSKFILPTQKVVWYINKFYFLNRSHLYKLTFILYAILKKGFCSISLSTLMWPDHALEQKKKKMMGRRWCKITSLNMGRCFPQSSPWHLIVYAKRHLTQARCQYWILDLDAISPKPVVQWQKERKGHVRFAKCALAACCVCGTGNNDPDCLSSR